MPEQQKEVPQINGMPLASVQPEPRPFSQSVPEHTTGSVVVVERARIKATRYSQSEYPKGNAIPLAYQLKVPTQEPVFAIFNLYSLIRDLVFTFDRQHEESWFEAYPQAVILHAGETFPSRDQLRSDYRKYATRLAHYAYYYRVAHTMRSAALINLLTLSRFQGKTKRKDVATLVRWSFINRNTGDFAIYPQPIGSINSMIDAAKPASGTTSSGVSVLALPFFDVSVYGNLGNHAGSLKDGIVDVKPDIKGDNAGAYGYGNDNDDVTKFYENAAAIVADYYDSKSFDILNPASLVLEADGSDNLAKAAIVSLQSDGRSRFYDSDPEHATSITETAWKNYHFWANALAQQFREMRDPAHDIFKLFIQLKFVSDDTPTAEQMMNAIHSSSFYDITSLRNAMQYMHEGKANTATIVRQCLPLVHRIGSLNNGDGVSIDKTTRAIFEQSVFEDNFERFKFYRDTATEWVHTAKLWPGLTPRMFPDSDPDAPENQAALVVNATSSDGSIAPYSEGFTNAGKYASYFDYATHQTLDPAKSIVEMSAVGEATAKAVVDNREGFICAEDPSQVFVKTSKFLDVSDPFQCGFFLLSSVPDSALSELEQFLSSPTAFVNAADDVSQTQVVGPNKFVLAKAILDGVPISIHDTSNSNKDAKAVVPTATCFQTAGWYTMLFLGDMPFILPQARSLLNSFALPVETSQAVKKQSDAAKASPSDAVGRKINDLMAIAAIEVLETAASPAATAPINAAVEKALVRTTPDKSNTTLISKFNDLFRPAEAGNSDFYLASQKLDTHRWGALSKTAPAGLRYPDFRLKLTSWMTTTTEVISGKLEFLDASGNVSSEEEVKFYPQSAFKKQNHSISLAPRLTASQMVALQAANAQSEGQVNAQWVKPGDWVTKTKPADGSVYAVYYTAANDPSGEIKDLDYDINGYKLAIQIPVATIASDDSIQSAVGSIASLVDQSGSEAESKVTLQSAANLDEIFVAQGANARMALWRFATNVRREKEQKTRAVAFYAEGDGKFVVNPAAIIASLLASSIGKAGAARLYMFNPQYGPVAIINPPIPQDADYGFQPDIATDTNKVAQGGLPDPIYIRMGLFQEQAAFGARSNQRASYQDTQWASHLWRWAIKAFAFQQAKIVNGRPIVQAGDPVRFDDEIAQRWPLTMFAQLVVTFAGSGDIDFFDNVVGKVDTMQPIQAATTSPTTVNGLIFVPARLTTKKLTAAVENITGPDRTKETYASKQQAETYKVSDAPNPNYEKGNSRDRGTGAPNKAGRRRPKAHGNKRRKANKPDVDESSKDIIDTANLAVKETGSLDQSPESVDKSVERKFRKPEAGVPLQLA